MSEIEFDFKKRSMCFVIMFFCMLFRYLPMWNIITSNQRYLILPLIVSFLFIFIASKRCIDKKRIIFLTIIIVIGLLDYLISNEIDIIISGLLAFIYLSKNGDKLFLKHFFICSIIFYIFTIILCNLNFIEDIKFTRLVDGITIIRHSLGFVNPNHSFTLLISIILSIYLASNFSNKKIFFSIVIILISYLIYSFTNCRTGLYSVLLFVILIFLEKIFGKSINIKFKYLFLFLTIISFAIALFFGNSEFMNKLLTTRPSMWLSNISSHSISLFGSNDIKLDNNYLWLIYRHGILIYLFYFYIYFKTTKNFILNYKLFISLFIILIYSLFENMLNYSFNSIFILALLYFINDEYYDMALYKTKGCLKDE